MAHTSSSGESTTKMRERDAIVTYLNERRWTHYVTLATHDMSYSLSIDRLKGLAKLWEAKMHQILVGAHWVRKYDERFQGFYVIEKPRSSPHLHAILQLDRPDDQCSGRDTLLTRARALEYFTPFVWKRLSPSGSSDVKIISTKEDQTRIVTYITKELLYPQQFENYILSGPSGGPV